MAARKLTVVQVLPALESGGVERGTVELAAELVRRGHRSIVISGGGRLVPELLKQGSEHITWPIGAKSLLTLRFVSRLRKFLQHEQVDILHARSRLPAWIAYFAWRKLPADHRPHFVTTVHGFYSVSRYSAIMTKGERVIAVSKSIVEYVQSHYPRVKPERIALIPRGVDRSQYPYGYQPGSDWRNKWNSDFPGTTGKWLITLPGRLTRLKGHEDFLSVLADLQRSSIPFHGLIVGGYESKKESYYRDLRQEVKERGLQGDVTFVGQRADLREIMAISDVVLSMSSRPESFGRTTLEALSLGTPVLGYAHGGVGEQLAAIFPEGAVAVGDWREVSQRLQGWYQCPPTVPARHGFTLQRMFDRTEALYIDVTISPHL